MRYISTTRSKLRINIIVGKLLYKRSLQRTEKIIFRVFSLVLLTLNAILIKVRLNKNKIVFLVTLYVEIHQYSFYIIGSHK